LSPEDLEKCFVQWIQSKIKSENNEKNFIGGELLEPLNPITPIKMPKRMAKRFALPSTKKETLLALQVMVNHPQILPKDSRRIELECIFIL
jgi:hypothetical protein